MTFDIIFQGFIAGESSEQGGSQMREILAPHVTDEDGSFLRVRFGDGDADIYLGDPRGHPATSALGGMIGRVSRSLRYCRSSRLHGSSFRPCPARYVDRSWK